MLAPRIYATEYEITERLWTVFEVTRDEVTPVIAEVVGARADAVIDDPLSAAGLFGYIHGTRNTRALWRSKGWHNFRKDNIEGVRHPQRDLRVIYQNVDLAASRSHYPQPLSGKGSGSERLIEETCGSLFSEEELDALSGAYPGGNRTGTWYFCVSVNGDDVRAELSLPTGLSGGKFKQLIERIFLVSGGEWSGLDVHKPRNVDVIEFEPVVTRR